MRSNLYISLDEVFAELLSVVEDQDLQIGITPGEYKGFILDAIRFIELGSFYEIKYKDVPVDGDVIELPKGSFDIHHLFLLDVANNVFANVNYKRNVYSSGGIQTANNLPNNIDTIQNHLTGFSYCGRIIAGNVVNGKLHLLSNTNERYSSFNKLRVVYRGLSEDSEDKCILLEAKKAIIDYASMEVYNKLKARDRKYRIDYSDAYSRFYGGNNRRDVGSYTLIKRHLASMNKFEREAMKVYLANPKHY